MFPRPFPPHSRPTRHPPLLLAVPILGLPLLALPLLVAGGVAWAGSSRHCRPPQPPWAGGPDPREMGQAMVSEALDEIGADADQKARIEAILEDSHERLASLHDGMEEHHDAVRAVLTAESIDREALENLRRDGLAALDQASVILTAALADAAEELTPAQREAFAALVEERHGE
jgi:Spy/CpxP family protein refolding chaperone